MNTYTYKQKIKYCKCFTEIIFVIIGKTMDLMLVIIFFQFRNYNIFLHNKVTQRKYAMIRLTGR